MTNESRIYSPGDWLIHRVYGVGQVVDLEEKSLQKKVRSFYKVKTKDSTFWLPLEKAVSQRVEPLPSKYMVKKAISTLGKAPEMMSEKAKERRKRIDEVRKEGSLISTARLIRDLNHLNSVKKLTSTEMDALNGLTERFIKIGSVCLGLEVEVLRRRLNQKLSENHEPGSAGIS
jgi:RNA polymerase-interacting CarD/CdnL/TRCF family regulator